MSTSFGSPLRRPGNAYDEYLRAAYGPMEEYRGTFIESGLEQTEKGDGDIQGGAAAGNGGALEHGPGPGASTQVADDQDGGGKE